MERLAGFLGLSLVSGVNLYLAVLVAGLGQRFGWFPGLPNELAALGHPLVLAVAALLYLLEFLADKVPFVTPVWDAVHTVIRPLGGALLAVGAAGQAPPLVQALAGLLGGTLALGTHGTKMGARLLAHTVPDPATHGALSVAEDLGVVALLVLAFRHPWAALPLLLGLVALLAWVLPRMVRLVGFLFTSLAARLRAPGSGRLPWAWQARVLERNPAGADLAVEAFAARAQGTARLRRGVLARFPDGWAFGHRSLFRLRWLPLEAQEGAPLLQEPGWLWDRVAFRREGRLQVFLVPKSGPPLPWPRRRPSGG